VSATTPNGRAAPHGALLRRIGPLAAIGVLSLVLALGGEEVRQWARYEREALEAGQLWRVATAHLVHLGWSHLGLNLLGLGLLGALLHDVLTAREWLAAAAAGALGIVLGLYLLDQQILWYVGLSGVLHAMLGWGAVRLLEERRLLGIVLIVSLAAKLAWEQWDGALPLGSAATGPVIVEAHLYGALAGGLAAAASRVVRRGGFRPL
jgi:rhomboid family GlyGly-CTERM serine protease